jgi:acyl-CoA thioesterase FadM
VGVNAAELELERDGYRAIGAVPTRVADFDTQGHLNNAATVRLFNDMRVEYVHSRIGAWWPEAIQANNFVIAAREVHVLYESEGRPGEQFVGGMKYVARQGKALVLEQRLLEAVAARSIARAWVVQLLVQHGRVVDWPTRYVERAGEIEGRVLPAQPRPAVRPWGPNLDTAG